MRFFIVAQQRSGTHYLATLLDSHPDLKCFDEVKRQIDNPMLGNIKIREVKDNQGAIVMYNQLPNEPSKS